MTKGMNLTMKDKNTQKVPQYIIDGFARLLLPEIQKSYQDDEGNTYYEKWSAEQEIADENRI